MNFSTAQAIRDIIAYIAFWSAADNTHERMGAEERKFLNEAIEALAQAEHAQQA